MLFEDRTGPDFGDRAPTYPPTGEVAPWYQDAKFGIFVHWGLFSVPAWADLHRDVDGNPVNVPIEDAYKRHRYAEWYANSVRVEGSTARLRHEQVYGVGTNYEDFADAWELPEFDAGSFIGQLTDAGARYIVPVTKHHDGFCLWDTATTGFNSVKRGPGRDLMTELHDATRAAGVRFGTYFSGAHDWHVDTHGPITNDAEIFLHRRNDVAFARYSAAQLREIIDRFRPDVLWNDIDWPDAGKGPEDYGVAALLREYFDAVPHGVTNDRWGVPYHGYLTREYHGVDGVEPRVWEATRGLGYSFGYNQDEGPEESMSGAEVIHFLIDTVAKNGNLLLNIGPRADGSIPEIQARALAELGSWLRTNGEAIFATRPWLRPGSDHIRYTQGRDGAVNLISLDPSAPIELPPELEGRDLHVVGKEAAARVSAQDGRIESAEILRVVGESPAAVITAI